MTNHLFLIYISDSYQMFVDERTLSVRIWVPKALKVFTQKCSSTQTYANRILEQLHSVLNCQFFQLMHFGGLGETDKSDRVQVPRTQTSRTGHNVQQSMRCILQVSIMF